MKTQEVLILLTELDSLRSKVIGWTAEDSNLFISDKHIGMTPSPVHSDVVLGAFSPNEYYPSTVLEALANGFKLLAPPIEHTGKLTDDGPEVTQYEWWLTRN